MHPATKWTIISLCRGTDPNRATRFRRILECLNTKGEVSDLDDDSEQSPLPDTEVDNAVLRLIPSWKPDLVITHSPEGEYVVNFESPRKRNGTIDGSNPT